MTSQTTSQPRIGLELLSLNPALAQHWGRLGLLTNPSGVTRELVPAAVALLQAGLPLTRLFGPEHGIDGSGAPGEAPEAGQDAATGLPTSVLYHLTDEQMAERLTGIDTLLVDLQDVGVRFYTYISTIREVLRVARRGSLRVVILDRPNPLGFTVEGPPLAKEFLSFVGVTTRLPLRHGLTIGEVSRVLAAEEGAEVEVIRTEAPDGWPLGRAWVPPSPNLPDLPTTQLYPGACLVEALDASEGRGTTLPFRLFGAPGLDALALARRINALELGVRARAAFFTPLTSKHQGQRCAGIQLHEQSHEMGTAPQCVLPVGLALFTALEEAGARRNPDWLQKLLGVPADTVPSTPELALSALAAWQAQGLQQSQSLSEFWLYPRAETIQN